MEREPCPHRIVDDAGGAFAMGLVGGGIWNFFGGLRNAPKGSRFVQAVARVQARTPILGGSFAIWGVLFSSFDCSISYMRKKEDPWNAIISGAATGGVLAARAGLKSAARSGAVGGVLMAAIEGLNIVIQRVLMPYMEKKQNEAAGTIHVDLLDPPIDPLRPSLYTPEPIYVPQVDGLGQNYDFSIDDSKWETDKDGITNEIDNTNTSTNKEKKSWLPW